MTDQILLNSEIWRFLLFFQKNFSSKKLRYKIIFSELEILNPMLVCCRGTLRVAIILFNYDCLIAFVFSYMAFCYDFLIFVSMVPLTGFVTHFQTRIFHQI